MSQHVYDVVIVGGGLAGLRTGILLSDGGKDLVVLEANDRVGGRTKGEIINDVYQLDVGGQWIGPTQNRMYALTKHYGLRVFPQHTEGRPYQYLNNRMVKNRTKDIPGAISLIQLPLLAGAFLYIDYMAKQVPITEPWLAKRAEEWDCYSVETWMRSSWWAPTMQIKSVVDAVCWALLATEPERVSFLWFLWFVHQAGGLELLLQTAEGAQQDKIDGAAVSVSQRMAEDLGDKVKLSSPVATISNYTENITQVQLENGTTLLAHKVVIACSPTMAGRITYHPALPACRDSLTQGYLMGTVIKTLTFYSTPFWREQGYSGEGVSDHSIRLTFDASFPEVGLYGIVGFFLGDSALEWADRTLEERKQHVIQHYTKLFGEIAATPVEYTENNWLSEPYIRGAYMAIPPPMVLSRVGPSLRTPIGNIHFAGTETAIQWSGYMEGALQSAERVSSELLHTQDVQTTNTIGFNFNRKTRHYRYDLTHGNYSLFKIALVGALLGAGVYLNQRFQYFSF